MYLSGSSASFAFFPSTLGADKDLARNLLALIDERGSRDLCRAGEGERLPGELPHLALGAAEELLVGDDFGAAAALLPDAVLTTCASLRDWALEPSSLTACASLGDWALVPSSCVSDEVPAAAGGSETASCACDVV